MKYFIDQPGDLIVNEKEIPYPPQQLVEPSPYVTSQIERPEIPPTHHKRLWEAVMDLKRVTDEVEAFLEIIQGESHPKKPQEGPAKEPTLQFVLQEAPDQINTSSNQIRGLLKEIKIALYGVLDYE